MPPKSAKTPPDFSRVEFHRYAMALLPGPEDRMPGITYLRHHPLTKDISVSCNCKVSKEKTCPHLPAAQEFFKAMQKAKLGSAGLEDSFWHKLAKFMAEDSRETAGSIQLRVAAQEGMKIIRVLAADQTFLAEYFSCGPDGFRFVERCAAASANGALVSRGQVLRELVAMTRDEIERKMFSMGHKTRKMSFEENFWYWFGYHGYREFGVGGISFAPGIEESSGEFMVTMTQTRQDRPICRLRIHRPRVKSFFKLFQSQLEDAGGVALHPVPLDFLLDVKLTQNLDVALSPCLRLIQKNGEFRLLNQIDFKRHRYGDLIFIPDLNMLADMQAPGGLPEELMQNPQTIISRSQVSTFIEKHATELPADRLLGEDISRLKILEHYDQIEIDPQVLERDWCWLSVTYGFGSEKVSLMELLQARQAGQRFIATEAGWVDCQADAFKDLDPLLDLLGTPDPGKEAGGLIKTSRLNLFRIKTVCPTAVFKGDKARIDYIEQLFALKAPEPIPDTAGQMTTALREYQKRGAEWLWFLWTHNLGGLLCDDMGLGKTHQVMALMLACRQKTPGHFLVVCPTTVMSHWERKLSLHAPDMRAGSYHGGGRDLGAMLAEHKVLITSYGVMLRDCAALSQIPFALVIFDEMQYLKNNSTKTYQAAEILSREKMRIGLTGTPIENRLRELKALMDLVNPGYLGSNENFDHRYLDLESNLSGPRRRELSQLISPFVLRRLKSTVLSELPPKIEDIRTCLLSPEQVRLYRDAIESRRKGILEHLDDTARAVPYIHIFALLTLLKQICNHPALVEKAPDNYAQYESGKWELFKELLEESLESGQKVVVYSQFVSMIRIITTHLKQSAIGHAVLTGQSRNRGAIVENFNTNPACRVFVGSLKAGGTGIDLVAASVVIHYDRWWNAAKEDQATDRVHRIGQQRGVQVFKLVTEGTLEEKIAAIIARKKDLMAAVIREDDPDLLKSFTREELTAMLALPETGSLE